MHGLGWAAPLGTALRQWYCYPVSYGRRACGQDVLACPSTLLSSHWPYRLSSTPTALGSVGAGPVLVMANCGLVRQHGNGRGCIVLMQLVHLPWPGLPLEPIFWSATYMTAMNWSQIIPNKSSTDRGTRPSWRSSSVNPFTNLFMNSDLVRPCHCVVQRTCALCAWQRWPPALAASAGSRQQPQIQVQLNRFAL